jgi:hypothetical protein
VLPNGNIVAGGSRPTAREAPTLAAVLYNPTTGNRVSGIGTDGKRKVDLFGSSTVGWGRRRRFRVGGSSSAGRRTWVQPTRSPR